MNTLKETIKYIASHEIKDLGKVKLAKLLFFIDREIWVVSGKEKFFNVDFLRRQYGPLAVNYNEVLGAMQDSGEIKIEQVQDIDYTLHRISLNNQYNPEKIHKIVDKQEFIIINYVIKKFGPMSARTLVDLTHDKTWAQLPEGAIMPYESYLDMMHDKAEIPAHMREKIDKAIEDYEQQKKEGTLK